jgi:hypothetical protein
MVDLGRVRCGRGNYGTNRLLESPPGPFISINEKDGTSGLMQLKTIFPNQQNPGVGHRWI